MNSTLRCAQKHQNAENRLGASEGTECCTVVCSFAVSLGLEVRALGKRQNILDILDGFPYTLRVVCKPELYKDDNYGVLS